MLISLNAFFSLPLAENVAEGAAGGVVGEREREGRGGDGPAAADDDDEAQSWYASAEDEAAHRRDCQSHA